VIPERIAVLFRTYAVRPHPGGPRLTLGVVWFGALLVVLALGSTAVTVLFTVVASIGALQVAGAWRLRKVAVNQELAAMMAALLPLAAWFNVRAVAVVMLLMVGAVLVLGTETRPTKDSFAVEHLKAGFPVASATLRSGLFIGLCAAAVVQVHRIDAMSLLFLLSIVCVYDSGHYLIGAGYRNRLVGPVAGLVGTAVVTVAMTAINPPPLTNDGDVRLLGLLMALSCPLGQMLGSWTMPSARSKAPALRRLDSWMVAAPVFFVGLRLIGQS